MKHISSKILIVVVALGTVQCAKDDNRNPSQDPATDGRAVLNNNPGDLQQRVTYTNKAVDLYKNATVDLSIIAEVSAPEVNSIPLAATHIAFSGNTVLVTYHAVDDPYGGSIEVFDISNPEQPVLVSQLTFEDTDVHNGFVDGQHLFVAGARSTDASGYDTEFTRGAVAQKIALNGNLLTLDYFEEPLPSFSNNAIAKQGNSILNVTGSEGGGLFYLDAADLAFSTGTPIEGAKYVAARGEEIAVLSGQSNQASVFYKANAGASLQEFSLGNGITVVGKNMVALDQNFIYASLGRFGLVAVDKSSGEIVEEYQLENASGLAIATDVDDDFVYLAHGSDGLILLENTLGWLEAAKITLDGSANFVASNNELVFVADGLSGIKILRKESPEPALDPYCTNETAFVPYGGAIKDKIRLTAMGTYQENGSGNKKRWRIRNERDTPVTVTWSIVSGLESGTFNIPASTEVHFSTASGGTMRIFEGLVQRDVKAHGGSTKDLADCRGEEEDDDDGDDDGDDDDDDDEDEDDDDDDD